MLFAEELRSTTKRLPHPIVKVDLSGIEDKCREAAQMGLYMVLIHNFGLNPAAQKIWKDKYGLVTKTVFEPSENANQTMIYWYIED